MVKPNILSVTLFIVLFVFSAMVNAGEKDESGFSDIVEDSELVFLLPNDFNVIGIVENPDVEYQYAIKHKTEKLEIRYVIRSLKEDMRDYEESLKESIGGGGVHPNALYPAHLGAICLNISGGGDCKAKYFNPEDVRAEFSADGGMATMARLDSIFGKGYGWANITVIHRDGVADAYAVYLFDDPMPVLGTIFRDDVFHALRFKE